MYPSVPWQTGLWTVETTEGKGASYEVLGKVGCDGQGKVRVWGGGIVWV